MQNAPDRFDQLLVQLIEKAGHFVPVARGEQTVRRWIPPTVAATYTTAESYAAFAEETADLAQDFLLSVPSPSGGTAFDRMSRGFKGTPEEIAALEALHASRFRVLRIDRGLAGGLLEGMDLVSQASVLLYTPGAKTLTPGLVVFSRLAHDHTGLLYVAGVMTPLDEAALQVATGPACPARFSREKESRWVETVYTHVVRHGTARIPGLNAAEEVTPLSEIPAELAEVVSAFHNLDGAAPDEALVASTRRLMGRDSILMVTTRVWQCRARGESKLAQAFERVALVLLETLHNRETMIGRAAPGYVSVETVGRTIDEAVTEHGAPAGMRDVFRELCRRAGSTNAATDDADMQRLIGRIRALRAKTVDQGCTEEEALAAAEKAAELLDRHGLTLSELEIARQPCGGVAIATGRKRLAAADHCAPAIAAFFDCRHWTEQPPEQTLRHVFFGMRADVAAAEFLFAMVERVFADEVAAFHKSDIYQELRGDRHAATKSFQEGLAHGIRMKLQALREARASKMVSSSGRDLVPVKSAAVDGALEKLGLTLNSRVRHAGSRVLLEPFEAGQAAAERFAYLPGIASVR
jgi:hypothetical protein